MRHYQEPSAKNLGARLAWNYFQRKYIQGTKKEIRFIFWNGNNWQCRVIQTCWSIDDEKFSATPQQIRKYFNA